MIGGWSEKRKFSDIDVYNIELDEWRANREQLKFAKRTFSSCLLGDYIYLLYDERKVIERIDARALTETSQPLQSTQIVHTMPNLKNPLIAPISESEILIAGGFHFI